MIDFLLGVAVGLPLGALFLVGILALLTRGTE